MEATGHLMTTENYETYLEARISSEEGTFIQIATWPSYSGPTTPGTYPITEQEASKNSCGLCVFLNDELNAVSPDFFAMPQAGVGSVIFEEVPASAEDSALGQTFKGSLSGVTFRRLDPSSGELHPESCALQLGELSWEVEIGGSGTASLD